jgi:hypothetical protein
LRPFNGSSTIRLFSMTVPTVAFSVASTAASAATSMDSVTCPTGISKSMRAVCCTSSWMFGRVTALKPGFSTRTL